MDVNYELYARCAVTSVFFLSCSMQATVTVLVVSIHNTVHAFSVQVDIIGQSNVPAEGPIIFTGNHGNQFVDALQVRSPANPRSSNFTDVWERSGCRLRPLTCWIIRSSYS